MTHHPAFEIALNTALARRGMDPEILRPPGDPVARRVVQEYGAMYLAAAHVKVPGVCIFESHQEVQAFQDEAGWSTATIGVDKVELQPSALEALLAARADALAVGLDITPRGGSEASRRGFEDSIRLWRSRFEPALEHWGIAGRLTRGETEDLRALPLRQQIAAVLDLEQEGLFFSKDFSKSILRSVAAPGASQHLAMLAFDVNQFRDAAIRKTLAQHGWFQTVLSDLPHFTYLGLAEDALPAHGLVQVEECGQQFWIPNLS